MNFIYYCSWRFSCSHYIYKVEEEEEEEKADEMIKVSVHCYEKQKYSGRKL